MSRQQIKFILLTDDRHSLGTAVMVSQQGQNKQLMLLSEPQYDLTRLEHINILSMNAVPFMAWRGKVIGRRDNKIIFQAEEQIDENLRRHLRISIDMESYMFPVTHTMFKIPVRIKDISCGGVGIFCKYSLQIGAEFDFVVPCVEPPLIVRIQVLRELSSGVESLYSCQFCDLLPQEEALIQESVFEYDLRQNSGR